MTIVRSIEVLTAELPFRFSFGHALAARSSSTNVYVRLTLDDGSVGWGEAVPREYVTGESVPDTVATVRDHFAPALLGRAVNDPTDVPALLDEAAASTPSPDGKLQLAGRCAAELSLLDACGRSFGCSVSDWLGPVRDPWVQYDAVIPFTKPAVLAALAVALRALRIPQVKVKVGADLQRDLETLRLLRRAMGPGTDLRVDANCAWGADQALDAIERMRRYQISAVEQPVAAEDHDGLRQITASTSETIIVDESLRTVEEALALAGTASCDAFNIRVSKCGGLLNSLRVAQIAKDAGLACVVGAQVGESGILSAAARHLASAIGSPRYVEGSAGRLLLKEDITVENVMPGWGGRARPYDGPGLGVQVDEARLRKHARASEVIHAQAVGPS